jgi:hypothetical protein
MAAGGQHNQPAPLQVEGRRNFMPELIRDDRFRPLVYRQFVGVSLLEATEVIERMLPRYHAKVVSLGCDVTLRRLREIMYLKFPDLRAVANALEFEVGVTG